MKSKKRITSTGEIFTPPKLVDEIVDKLPDDLFTNPNKTFLDPAAGDSEFLRGIIRRFRKDSAYKTRDFWHTFDNQLYGTELMWDNVCDSVYFILTTKSCDEDKNKSSREENPVIQDGFNQPIPDDASPDEINGLFTQTRIYKLDKDDLLHVRKIDNHFVEYMYESEQQWIKVEHIVRANALTEWDFENWKPL